MHACMHAIAYIQALTALSSAGVTFAISLSLSPASRLDPAPSSASQIPGVIHFARITPITNLFFFHFFENGTRQRILHGRPLQRPCTAPGKKKMSLLLLHFICETLSPNGNDSYSKIKQERVKIMFYIATKCLTKLRDRTVKSNSYQTRKILISYLIKSFFQ